MTAHFPPLEIDLDYIAVQAAKNQDDYEAFRYYIELDEQSDVALDALAEEVAAPVVAGIDCTTCANCCRHLSVYLTAADAARLANGINVSMNAFTQTYVETNGARAEGEWGKLQARPCPFLLGKLCSIYPHRPESCRLYPVFSPDFRWTLEDLFGGIGLCPIIYNVVERLKIVLKW